MSKYQKINIVESKSPPSNKYDWWYDENTEELKRPKREAWVSIVRNTDSSKSYSNIGYVTVKYSTPDSGETLTQEITRLNSNWSPNVGVIPYENEALQEATQVLITSSQTGEVSGSPYHKDYLTAVDSLYIENGVHTITFSQKIFKNVSNIYLPDSVTNIEWQLNTHKNLSTLRLGHGEDIGKMIESGQFKLPAGMDYGLKTILGPSSVEDKYFVGNNTLYHYANLNGYSLLEEGDNVYLDLPPVATIRKNAICYLPQMRYEEETDGHLYAYGHYINIPKTVVHIESRAFAFSSSGICGFTGKFAAAEGRCLVKDNELIIYAGLSGEEFMIPQGVHSIGSGAFQACKDIRVVHIPSSVTTINNVAFYNCTNLQDIYIEAMVPPTLTEARVFEGTSSGLKIHVPAESVEAYKTATNWAALANKIVGDNF